jgi:anti-sigma factor RsiW
MNRLHRTTSGVHVSGTELALYVIDALDAERKLAVESHVFACDACAEGLAREACAEAAFDSVARLANERERAAAEVAAEGEAHRRAAVVEIFAARQSAAARAHMVPARRSRWAGGIAGAFAAAAGMVLALSSATAHSEPSGVAVQRASLHDAAGDMSGAVLGDMSGAALGAEVAMRDSLDGG